MATGILPYSNAIVPRISLVTMPATASGPDKVFISYITASAGVEHALGQVVCTDGAATAIPPFKPLALINLNVTGTGTNQYDNFAAVWTGTNFIQGNQIKSYIMFAGGCKNKTTSIVTSSITAP